MASPEADTLLCESCGYALTGLGPDGVCPECGTPVDSSLPGRREGSAWQRGEDGGWWSTVRGFIRTPRDGFREIAIEPHRSGELRVRTTFVAAVMASTPWWLLATGFALAAGPFNARAAALGLLGVTIGTWGLLMLATWVESLGIRFFGRRRGWRVTSDVAAAVCAHATAGWICGGCVVLAGTVMGALAWILFGDSPLPLVLAFGGLGAGALVGLLWFEILVYMGVRVCRFANPPWATLAASQPGDAGAVSQSAPGAGRAPGGE